MDVVKYYLDGIDLRQYGVYISDSDGLLSKPKLKKPDSLSWPNYHGEVVYLGKLYYENRVIKLDCFIKANDPGDFIVKLNNFLALFDQAWTRRLSVLLDGSEPLVYEVYLEDGLDVKKKWNRDLMVGTFNLTLKEPEPVKRVLKYTRTGNADKMVSITLSSTKMLNIYWGDGSHAFDVSGTAQTLTHNYSTNGTFYIVVTGNIDEITSLTTTGKVVWAKI
jgi:hypothetical protein